MVIDQKRLQFLLQQYADNTCSREEMEELFRLIAKSRNNRRFNVKLLEIWNSFNPEERISLIDENVLFRQIDEKISVPPVRYIWFSWTKVAALILTIACAGIIYFLTNEKPANQISQNKSDVPKPEHKLLTLPDGSSVLLNTNSTLDFPAQFTGNSREVILKGEAYFDISKDPSRPFIIHTGNLKTRVLGTAFNIRAYPDELDVTVTVTRGKVKVETEDKILGILSQNQQISYNKKSSAAVHQQVLAESVLTWKENDLVFDNVTFEEAATVISKRYGVDILFENENMKKCRFHASFLNENKVEQVLTVLCELNKATYQIQNNMVMIIGEGCN